MRGPRRGEINRQTRETRLAVALNLDGSGQTAIATGVGFFDHMLDQLGRHALIDLTVAAEGDQHIDDHHTVEDTGIAIGQALALALGDRRGIQRFASSHLAMDEALTRVCIDLSGRSYLVFKVGFGVEKIGRFDTALVREFFQAFAHHAGMTLHIDGLRGVNAHHIAESCFKAVARALRDAVAIDPRAADAVPSTKGTLQA